MTRSLDSMSLETWAPPFLFAYAASDLVSAGNSVSICRMIAIMSSGTGSATVSANHNRSCGVRSPMIVRSGGCWIMRSLDHWHIPSTTLPAENCIVDVSTGNTY